MKTAIHYKTRTPELSDGFYHAACPVLFAGHDEITTVEECPFPLQTAGFTVLLFGKSKVKEGDTFAVVRYTKGCGHTVEERIAFQEGVQNFEHYGTKFIGADYSIQAWERRIAFFQAYPCDICSLVKHCAWCWTDHISEGNPSRKNALKRCLFLLDANFSNWQDFISAADLETRFLTLTKK